MKPGIFLASIVAALLAGGITGASFRRPANVKETASASAELSSKFDMREDWAASWNFTQHTPPKETIKWYVKYRPGAKPGECEIAEKGGEIEKVGPGENVAEAKSTGVVAAKGEAKQATSSETSRETHAAPLWFVGASGGVDTSLAKYAAINAGVRILGPLYLQAQVASSVSDVKPIVTVGVMVQF